MERALYDDPNTGGVEIEEKGFVFFLLGPRRSFTALIPRELGMSSVQDDTGCWDHGGVKRPRFGQIYYWRRFAAKRGRFTPISIQAVVILSDSEESPGAEQGVGITSIS